MEKNKKAKKIVILTSGGDAPGMNQCISALVRTSLNLGLQPYGVRDGIKGLCEGEIFPLTRNFIQGLARRGGTILYTSRYPEFQRLEVQERCAARLKAEGIDSVVMLGGDGTEKGARALAQLGIQTILIPASVDNDVPGTDFSIGFYSAVASCVHSIDQIRDTMESHSRLFIVQTMGRRCPDIALYSGFASGADLILTQADCPEYPEILRRVREIKARGQRYCLIVMSENLIDGQKLSQDLARDSGYETRYDVLGHTQRGGSPAPQDRILAQVFGAEAAKAASEGQISGTIGVQNETILLNNFSKNIIKLRVPRETTMVLEAERKAR